MNYTLIAHKPESADYCRGCLMESYDGDFQVEHNLSKEQLIDKAANFYSTNSTTKQGASYDLIIMGGGLVVMDDSTGYYNCEPEDRDEIVNSIHALCRSINEEREQKQKVIAEKSSELAKKKEEAEEKRQLKSLLKKYGKQ